MLDLQCYLTIEPSLLERFRMEAELEHVEVAIAQFRKDVRYLERQLPKLHQLGASADQISRIRRTIELGRERIACLEREMREFETRLRKWGVVRGS